MSLFRTLVAFGLLCCSRGSGQTLSFLAPVEAFVPGYSRTASLCQNCFVVADFNRDGKPDIAYAYFNSGVALGNGDGTFRLGEAARIRPNGGQLFTGDFNGDGNPDLANYNSVYMGDGAGRFGTPTDVAGCSSITLLTDINGDSQSDLICGSNVLLSNGDGRFRAAQSLGGQALLAADFNRDGNTDLLLRTGSQLAVAPGRGDGTFRVATAVSGSQDLQQVLAGDFNSDGRMDLVAAAVDGQSVVVLPGRGDGSFGPAINTPGLFGSLSAVADFNGDGRLDVTAGDAVLAGNGDGTFRFPVFIGVATQPCGAAAPGADVLQTPCDYARSGSAIADFNGDGLPDIAAGSWVYGNQHTGGNCVSVLLNNSPGDGFTATGVSSVTWTLFVPRNSYVSAFGQNLAPRTEAATTNPLPDTLGGIRLHVRDRSHSAERLAPLLYVSPTQINYMLESSDPYVWIGIERTGSSYVAKGMAVPVAFAAPSLAPLLYFFGDGFAAASAVTLSPEGDQMPVPVTSCTGQACTSVPIDVSGQPVYLTLFGTGFGLASTAETYCTAGGTNLPVFYAGPQTQTVGLDQANLLLPKSLNGSGEIFIACRFKREQTFYSNVVKVSIR